MSPLPKSGLWADVFPNDFTSRQFLWLVGKSTFPFLIISLFALVFDSLTHFPVEIGVTTYEVGGGVLGVFLVLRTNSGYERWWEARKLWGGMTNQCRSIATAAVAYGANDGWKKEIIHWTILFAHATRRRLRNECELPEAIPLVGDDNARELQKSEHVPLAIALKIARLFDEASERGQLSASILMQMERDRISLLDQLGGCERILKTPLPRAYNIVIRQFLVLFLTAFPFGVLQKVTWLTPLLTLSIAFPMLALDEIGAELQNPFSTESLNHLPLDSICKTIENNLLELLPDDLEAAGNA